MRDAQKGGRDIIMAKKPTGRPTKYTDQLANDICERLMNGESLASITRDDKMPARSSVHLWLANDKTFSDKYEVARQIQADTYADEMEDIARDEKLDVQRARLIVDTRKWVSSKLKPKKYGDKVDLTSDGEKIQPLLVKFVGDDDKSDS